MSAELIALQPNILSQSRTSGYKATGAGPCFVRVGLFKVQQLVITYLHVPPPALEPLASVCPRVTRGLQPTAKDWSALLRAHAKQGDLEGAGAVCGAMGEAGVPADGAAYAALAHVYMLHNDAAAIVRPPPPPPPPGASCLGLQVVCFQGRSRTCTCCTATPPPSCAPPMNSNTGFGSGFRVTQTWTLRAEHSMCGSIMVCR